MSFYSGYQQEYGSHDVAATAIEIEPPVKSCGVVSRPIGDAMGQERTFNVRLADAVVDHQSACSLINKMYLWRGYGDNHTIPIRPTHSTFTGSIDDEVVGTITLAVDSPAGLAADDIFRDEIDAFRCLPNARVCELTKLAFNTAMPSKPMLAALFHIVFIYGQRRYECTDLFIEVNPRHRRFYACMLGFKPVGAIKINVSVEAPAQLMHLAVADIRSQIDEHAGLGDAASARSLYPFFFSPREETSVFEKLKKV